MKKLNFQFINFVRKMIACHLILALLISACVCTYGAEEKKHAETVEEDLYGVKYAGECEVCKYLVIELMSRLSETGKSHDVIEIGYDLDRSSRKKKKYAVSELRLIESLDGICDRLLEYNIHKERKDSTRFAKGMSTTFEVLHGLVDKGVKVELGIPEDLWDKPSAEVTHLKMQCENLLEKHEANIEDWYFHHQDVPLREFLCVQRVLHKGDMVCLDESFVPTKEDRKSKGESQNVKKQPKNSQVKKKKVPSNKGETKDEL